MASVIAELPHDLQAHVWALYVSGLEERRSTRHARAAVALIEALCDHDGDARDDEQEPDDYLCEHEPDGYLRPPYPTKRGRTLTYQRPVDQQLSSHGPSGSIVASWPIRARAVPRLEAPRELCSAP